MKSNSQKWVFNSYGDPSVLQKNDDVELKPNPGELAVKVAAFSINPIDWKLMGGGMRYMMPAKFPVVPCFDVAGTVEDANGCAGFHSGDRVFVRLNTKAGGAAQANVAVNASVAAKMPANMAFEQGAAIPLAGLTALQGLRDHGGMKADAQGQRILIIGASGGVGHFAVQIARAAGAHVTAVCGTTNVDLVKGLGADEVIDYRATDSFESRDELPYDIVLDCVGESPFDFSQRFAPVMKSDSVYVTPAPSGQMMLRMLQFWRRPKLKMFLMKPSADDLKILADLFIKGKFKAVIDSTYSFEKVPDAFAKGISGRVVGKVVVKI